MRNYKHSLKLEIGASKKIAGTPSKSVSSTSQADMGLLWRAQAQRHTNGQVQNSSQEKGSTTKSLTCVYFNKNTCSQKQTHDTRGVLYKHTFADCWANEVSRKTKQNE